MDIPVGVQVYCKDGLCGRSTYILINPVLNEVTHVVVREAQSPHTERVVPIDAVSETTPDVILLRYTSDTLRRMEPFTQIEYIREEMPDAEHWPAGYVGMGSYRMWPYAIPERTELVPVEHRRIPLGELAIKRGTRVQATDGHIGRVDEFLVEPTSEHITHLMMREGHLWGQSDVAIPVSEIDHVEDGVVYLKLSKDEVGALPAIPVRKRTHSNARRV
jgi:sporulation protein YlmC with PRC-barrel domain